MEKLQGHGLRDDAIGVMQVGETITEILVNGWWIITVEDCMTNLHGHGYYLELLVNHRKLSLEETGFLTIDDTVDGMFAYEWSHVLAVLTINIDHFKDRVPRSEPEGDECGWCGSTTYPHICDGTLTEQIRKRCEAAMVTTANASAPKPPKRTQARQDMLDMSKAWGTCICPSRSGIWQEHAVGCLFHREGDRIQHRKDRVARWKARSMSA